MTTVNSLVRIGFVRHKDVLPTDEVGLDHAEYVADWINRDLKRLDDSIESLRDPVKLAARIEELEKEKRNLEQWTRSPERTVCIRRGIDR